MNKNAFWHYVLGCAVPKHLSDHMWTFHAGSGELDFGEFLALLAIFTRGSRAQRIRLLLWLESESDENKVDERRLIRIFSDEYVPLHKGEPAWSPLVGRVFVDTALGWLKHVEKMQDQLSPLQRSDIVKWLCADRIAPRERRAEPDRGVFAENATQLNSIAPEARLAALSAASLRSLEALQRAVLETWRGSKGEQRAAGQYIGVQCVSELLSPHVPPRVLSYLVKLLAPTSKSSKPGKSENAPVSLLRFGVVLSLSSNAPLRDCLHAWTLWVCDGKLPAQLSIEQCESVISLAEDMLARTAGRRSSDLLAVTESFAQLRREAASALTPDAFVNWLFETYEQSLGDVCELLRCAFERTPRGKEIFERLVNSNVLRQATAFYLVSERWWNVWNGEIDNSDLREANGRIREPAPAFLSLEEAQWDMLCSWFDCKTDELVRYALAKRDSDELELFLHPATVNVRRRGEKSSKARAIALHSGPLVEHALQDIGAALRLDAKSIRLWRSIANEQILLESSERLEHDASVMLESRNYDGTWPSNAGYTVEGVRGMRNLGNTCFMNSSIQCLSQTNALSVHFHSGKWKSEVNKKNPLGHKGNVAQSYNKLLSKLAQRSNSPVMPLVWQRSVASAAPQFRGMRQHDAQEFLGFLLDALHEDLNRVLQKPYIEVADDPDASDEQLAERWWHAHAARNDSIVVDLFHGQLKSVISCAVCDHRSTKFDPFTFLSLPLAGQSHCYFEIEYYDAFGLATQYGVRVKRDSDASAVRRKLSALLAEANDGIAPNPKRIELISGRAVHPETPASALPLRLVAFVVPKRHAVVAVLHRTAVPHNNALLADHHYELFGAPAFVAVPRTQLADAELVLNHLTSQLRCAGSGVPPRAQWSASLVDSTGLRCRQCPWPTLCTGCELSGAIPSGSTVALNWSPLARDAYFRPQKVRVDRSVHAMRELRDQPVSLVACLNAFLSPEQLPDGEWYCSKCKEHRAGEKKFDLWRLPKVLAFHLKRFSFDGRVSRKLDTPVEYPLEIDASELCAQAAGARYRLHAVINHMGSAGGGHYVAFTRAPSAKLPQGVEWVCFDDSTVRPVLDPTCSMRQAYVLFYELCE